MAVPRHTALENLRLSSKNPPNSFRPGRVRYRFSDDTERYQGDISIGNMRVEIPLDCGGAPIRVHEFDLSKHHPSSSSTHCGTGTLPFVSIDLLENPKAPHGIGFDVEALLWTLLWFVRVSPNGEGKHTDRDHPLSNWFANSCKLETIAAAKNRYLYNIGGLTNEFYRELEWEIGDLAYQWQMMRHFQLKERYEKLEGSLLSESLHGFPGFIKIQSWMEDNEWSKPRDPRSAGGEGRGPKTM